MIGNFLLLVGGVGSLFFGADWLVRGGAHLARRFQLSPIVIGLTIVALGTSAPELVVAVVASFKGSDDIALGNILGSNLANVGLILGLSALARPLRVAAVVVSREVPLMLVLSLLLYPLMLDYSVGRGDGAMLVALLVGYLLFMFRAARREPASVLGEYELFAEETVLAAAAGLFRDLMLVLSGSIGLVVGGYAIVESATYLARVFGVPELFIGLTVVAVGTSLPELATSLVAALRRESDIAVGNIIGSNIFNIASVLGIAALIRPLSVDPRILTHEMPAVLLLSALVLPVARMRYTIRRWEGVLLLATYLLLMTWLASAS